MSKKLYVGNLPYSTGDAELGQAFSACGTVSEAIVIMDRDSGRSKGFGFVTFENDADADKAMNELNNADMGGRKIRIDLAKEREPRAPRRNRY